MVLPGLLIHYHYPLHHKSLFAALSTMIVLLLIPHSVEALPTTEHSIMAQNTRLSYTLNGHNYASWASNFEDFLMAHDLIYHLTEPFSALSSSSSLRGYDRLT